MPALAKGGFYHAGQVCVSVQRMFAHRSRRSASWPQRLTEHARRARVGDPLLPETEVGPLIRPKEVERVDAWVEEAVGRVRGDSAAAKRCRPPATRRRCCSSRQPDCRVSTQEVFGPVVCVYAYD